jgi:hypothetical protein
LEAGNSPVGLKLVDEVLQAEPRNREAHRLLAGHFDRIGQPERAAEHRRLAGEPE